MPRAPRAGGGPVRLLDPLPATSARGADSVDSIHFGAATNRMLVQVRAQRRRRTARGTGVWATR
jgi:hypothetical protein